MKKLVSEQNSVRIFEEGNPAEISLLGKAPAIKEVRGLIRKSCHNRCNSIDLWRIRNR
ncbi:MAG: hypothetical protein ACLUD0_05585 [Eubacterium ramulus]